MTTATADTIDRTALDRELAGTPFAGKLRHFPTLGSTNTRAMREAEEGQASHTVYVADEQTAGRGRGVIMHTGVNVQGRGHSRFAIATPFCLLCIWPRKAFATNPLPVNTILLFTPDYS